MEVEVIKVKILDLDMDYFMEHVAHRIVESSDDRLAEKKYGSCVWSKTVLLIF